MTKVVLVVIGIIAMVVAIVVYDKIAYDKEMDEYEAWERSRQYGELLDV